MFRSLAITAEEYFACLAPIQGSCPQGTVQLPNGDCVAPIASIMQTYFPNISCGTPTPPPPPTPTCVSHGGVATTGDCCTGLKAWNYDANSGAPYNGFGCWSALCATLGQWAGPAGVGNYCCPPLVNIGGKCASAMPGGAGSGTTPVGTPLGIPTTYLYIGAAFLAVLLFMGGGKR